MQKTGEVEANAQLVVQLADAASLSADSALHFEQSAQQVLEDVNNIKAQIDSVVGDVSALLDAINGEVI